MNDTFSFSRLVMLLKKHWVENKKLFLISILTCTGLLVGFYFFLILVYDKNAVLIEPMQISIFYFSLGTISILYAIYFFNDLSSKSKGTMYLLSPSTTLEKICSAVFYNSILLVVIWYGIFYVTNNCMVMLLNKVAINNPKDYHSMFEQKKFIPRLTVKVFTYHSFGFAISLMYAIQAASLLGSIYFKKQAFIKTVASILGIWVILTLYNFFFLHKIMPTKFYSYEFGTYFKGGLNFAALNLVTYEPIYYLTLPEPMIMAIKYSFYFALYPLLITATYFRLKEKQI